MTTTMNTIETIHWDNNENCYVKGVKVNSATLLRQKGRGRLRAVWQGRPWEVALIIWKFGCVINDGTAWTVELNLANGVKHGMTLKDFLSVR